MGFHVAVNRRLIEQFQLRLPDGMRDRLKESADQHGRSTNAEIVERLRASLDESKEGVKPVWFPPQLWSRIRHEASVSETDPNLVIIERLERTFPNNGQQEIDFEGGQVVIAKPTLGPEKRWYRQMDDLEIYDAISRYSLEIAEAIKTLEMRHVGDPSGTGRDRPREN